MEKKNRINELTNYLNKCSIKYYCGMNTISDSEYDTLLDELEFLEKETNYILPNSPTQKIGFDTINSIEKVKLPFKMLSLNKIKNDLDAAQSWVNNDVCILSIKIDGGAVCLEYKDGKLVGAYTRGDGEYGSDVTDIVSTLPSVPNVISNKNHIVIVGEICIKIDDFEKINNSLPDNNKFSNPRNLATATLLNLDISLGRKRNLTFYAFDIQGQESYENQLEVLQDLNNFGFMTALNTFVTSSNLQICIESYKTLASQKGIPTDGMVLRLYNRNSYREAGVTSKYPKGAIAYKFKDETECSSIIDVEWSMGRTGVLTPILIIEPTEIYDTVVSRINGHNLSYLKLHKIGIGDKILFTKSNEIIPMLVENITRSNNIQIPTTCPCCGSELCINKDNDSKVLICKNSRCKGILSKKIEFYADRNNMNIRGLSEETTKALVYNNKIACISDLYSLSVDDVIDLPGFSLKKATNLIQAIKDSKDNVELYRFITSIGIENVGKTTAKAISIYCEGSLNNILSCKSDDLCNIDGISSTTAITIINHINTHKDSIIKLASYLTFSTHIEEPIYFGRFTGLSFSITGKLTLFKTRRELVEYIKENGGNVVSTVTRNTNYLINSNILSIATKNRKAKELRVPIITEFELLELNVN